MELLNRMSQDLNLNEKGICEGANCCEEFVKSYVNVEEIFWKSSNLLMVNKI